MFLWYVSCALNFMLLGNPREPLCSRVYGRPEGPLRNLYVTHVDALMYRLRGDWLHCLHIHATYLVRSSGKRR